MDLNDAGVGQFNSGLSIILILDDIKKKLFVATTCKDYELQFDTLKAYWKELGSLCDEKEDEYYELEYYKVEQANKNIQEAISSKKKSIPTEWIRSLDNFERKMRKLQQKKGLGMPRKDARFSMGN